MPDVEIDQISHPSVDCLTVAWPIWKKTGSQICIEQAWQTLRTACPWSSCSLRCSCLQKLRIQCDITVLPSLSCREFDCRVLSGPTSDTCSDASQPYLFEFVPYFPSTRNEKGNIPKLPWLDFTGFLEFFFWVPDLGRSSPALELLLAYKTNGVLAIPFFGHGICPFPQYTKYTKLSYTYFFSNRRT